MPIISKRKNSAVQVQRIMGPPAFIFHYERWVTAPDLRGLPVEAP